MLKKRRIIKKNIGIVDQLIPNLALREVLDDYVAKNEWAIHDL
jgi:hypothetical protein